MENGCSLLFYLVGRRAQQHPGNGGKFEKGGREVEGGGKDDAPRRRGEGTASGGETAEGTGEPTEL